MDRQTSRTIKTQKGTHTCVRTRTCPHIHTHTYKVNGFIRKISAKAQKQ